MTFFYVLALIVSFGNTAYYTILAMNTTESPYLYDPTVKLTMFEFLTLTGTVTNVAIGWLVATTMYHLMVSVRIIFKLETPEKGMK